MFQQGTAMILTVPERILWAGVCKSNWKWIDLFVGYYSFQTEIHQCYSKYTGPFH